jgi:glycine/D-amino acid oxidase-like deaminating enzyme
MSAASDSFDIAVVGAGIVGASAAYFSSPHRRVLLLEGAPPRCSPRPTARPPCGR